MRSLRPFQNANVIAHIAVHPSAKYVALAAADGAIRVHDVGTLALTHSLSAATALTALSFPPSADTVHLLSAHDDGSLHVFDLSHQSQSRAVHVIRSHVARVSSIAFASPLQLATASHDGTIALHRWRGDGRVSDTSLIAPGGGAIAAIAALPQGKLVTADARGAALRVWDWEMRREVPAARVEIPFVTVRRGIGAGNSGGGKKNVNDGDEDNGDDDDDDEIDDVAIAHVVPTADGVLAALSDQTVVGVRVGAGGALALAGDVQCGNLEEVYDVRFLADSEEVSGGERDFVVASNSPVVWVKRAPSTVAADESAENCKGWRCVGALQGHRGNILAVDAVRSADGEWVVVSASRDKTARVWWRGSEEWQCLGVAEGHTDAVAAVALAPRMVSGRSFMVSAGADRTLKKWGLDAVLKGIVKRGDDEEVSEYRNEQCNVVDARGSESVQGLSTAWTVLAHDKDVNAVAVSPDGSLIATGSQDRSVRVWSSENGQKTVTCTGHRKGVWGVAFSPVDRVLASASGDATVRVWSVRDGSCLRTLQGHMSGVLRVVFVSGGTQMVSGGGDGLVKVWTSRTGECECTMDGHEGRVWGVDAWGDGDEVVSVGGDGKVVRWVDRTEEEDMEERRKKEEEAVMGQVVESAARAKKWGIAVRGALELGMAHKVKAILSELVVTVEDPESELARVVRDVFVGDGAEARSGDDDEEGGVGMGEEDKRRWKGGWDAVDKLARYCRDWNASGGAKSAAVAGYVLQAVFSVWNVGALCDGLEADKRALVEALEAHCGRHVERVNGLAVGVAGVEHAVVKMRGVVNVAAGANGRLRKAAGVRADESGHAAVVARRKRVRREEVDCDY